MPCVNLGNAFEREVEYKSNGKPRWTRTKVGGIVPWAIIILLLLMFADRAAKLPGSFWLLFTPKEADVLKRK
jgi:hypothetical protein